MSFFSDGCFYFEPSCTLHPGIVSFTKLKNTKSNDDNNSSRAAVGRKHYWSGELT